MTLRTLGTNATNTLSAIIRHANPMTFTTADAAQIRANILNDQVNGNPIWPDAYREGQLFVPNRGVLKVLDGDWIAYDASGWPILISANAIAFGSTSWTHS